MPAFLSSLIVVLLGFLSLAAFPVIAFFTDTIRGLSNNEKLAWWCVAIVGSILVSGFLIVFPAQPYTGAL